MASHKAIRTRQPLDSIRFHSLGFHSFGFHSFGFHVSFSGALQYGASIQFVWTPYYGDALCMEQLMEPHSVSCTLYGVVWSCMERHMKLHAVCMELHLSYMKLYGASIGAAVKFSLQCSAIVLSLLCFATDSQRAALFLPCFG